MTLRGHTGLELFDTELIQYLSAAGRGILSTAVNTLVVGSSDKARCVIVKESLSG